MPSMETTFQSAIDQGKINGMVICATDARGTFTYTKALGHRTLLSGDKVPQRSDDVLTLASATKLVTTIAALQCVEDGVLSLAGDLSAIVPELTSKQVLTGFSESQPDLAPVDSAVTLQTLLSHSAGTSYYFGSEKLSEWNSRFNAPQPGQQMTVSQAWAHPLDYQPGKGWMYGGSLDWVGLVIERATGQSLGEYMRNRIFTQLGITDAEFYPLTRDELRSRHVDTNPDDPGGTGIAVMGDVARAAPMLKGDFGGHGLMMTAEDYIKILHSLLANDGKLLKPETADTMFTDQLSPESSAMHQAVIANPMAAPLFRAGTDAPTKVSYGFGGLVTLEDTDGFFGSNTSAWGGGNTLAWFIDRKNDVCAIGAVQAKVDSDLGLVNELKHVFRRGVYVKKNRI
ncbi:hypothetical protein Golomagni_05709 [Golovinomyces magnicellulatus]|nr:hypothetical protein Golomagni_05709 [Golovinomyces magnicellulatus]